MTDHPSMTHFFAVRSVPLWVALTVFLVAQPGCRRAEPEHPGHIEPVEGVEHRPAEPEQPDRTYRCMVSESVCEEFDDSAMVGSCTDFGGAWSSGPCSDELGASASTCTLEFKTVYYGDEQEAEQARDRCESRGGTFTSSTE